MANPVLPDVPIALAEQGFYELAATIIPVLFLVLFLGDGRVIRPNLEDAGQWRSTAMLGIGVVGVMLLGEMAALRAVSQGHDSYLLHGITVIALVYGFTFIFAQATKLLLLARAGSLSAARLAGLDRLYMAAVVIVLVSSYAILDPQLLP
jgi:hypothetical protein